MVKVILSPQAKAFVDALPALERVPVRRQLKRLGRPENLLALKPLLGAGPRWRVAHVGELVATCRILSGSEAGTLGVRQSVLLVATIDWGDGLQAEGQRLIDEGGR